MRTQAEALRELRSRLVYFCGRTDGKYDPPWAQELVGIIDDALAKDATAPLDMAECRSALEAIADDARSGSISALPIARLVERTCEKALEKPPRNCDRHNTTDEAYEQFCAYVKRENPACLNPSPLYTLWDGLDWMLKSAPAKSDESNKAKEVKA